MIITRQIGRLSRWVSDCLDEAWLPRYRLCCGPRRQRLSYSRNLFFPRSPRSQLCPTFLQRLPQSITWHAKLQLRSVQQKHHKWEEIPVTAINCFLCFTCSEWIAWIAKDPDAAGTASNCISGSISVCTYRIRSSCTPRAGRWREIWSIWNRSTSWKASLGKTTGMGRTAKQKSNFTHKKFSRAF